MKKKITIDELRGMTVKQLRVIDIQSGEEEELVQLVINEKMVVEPPTKPVYRGDVPDIKNGEDEAKWQKVIDERTEALKPKSVPVPAEIAHPVVLDDISVIIDEAKIITNGFATTETKIPETTTTVATKLPFCNTCDSKGRFHKKGCPNKV